MINARNLLLMLAGFVLALGGHSMSLRAADVPSNAEPGPLRGHKFAQIALQVTDLDRATAF